MTAKTEHTSDDAEGRDPAAPSEPADERSGGELRAKGVTVNGTPDPDDPAAVAPWPPPGQEHLAHEETKSRDEHDLPSPGVTIGGTPDPDDPAAVAPWTPDDGAEADQG